MALHVVWSIRHLLYISNKLTSKPPFMYHFLNGIPNTKISALSLLHSFHLCKSFHLKTKTLYSSDRTKWTLHSARSRLRSLPCNHSHVARGMDAKWIQNHDNWQWESSSCMELQPFPHAEHVNQYRQAGVAVTVAQHGKEQKYESQNRSFVIHLLFLLMDWPCKWVHLNKVSWVLTSSAGLFLQL